MYQEGVNVDERFFENNVEKIKYKVLREMARHAWRGEDAFTAFNAIAQVVVKKGDPTMSCCIYKDRAIIAEQMRIGLGEFHGSKDTVQVVSIACDECPRSGHKVTDLCRGCVAHSCREVCGRRAIAIDSRGYAHIDKECCIECGKCAIACKYSAITNMIRPCEKACPNGAIEMGDDGAASVNQDKCIVCGACIHECPFGAVNDISSIIEVINAINNKKNNQKIIAAVAPAVASQFPGTTVGQIFSAIKALGFDGVYEVAMGADATALSEAKELKEKGFLISSCCPSFVEYINIKYPDLKNHVSSTLSPMSITGKEIKEKHPGAKVIFIGPCVAKKYERKTDRSYSNIDIVLTFIELIALLDSKDIDISSVKAVELNDATPYGRGFAKTGGVANAINKAIEELKYEDFNFDPVICNGIKECKAALTLARSGKLKGNFIEGMVCEGGCINGNGTLVNKKNVNSHIEDYMFSSSKHKLYKG